ncbi:DUF2249 domain-containing protein [Halorubellus sp. PRR65]|uniref:DUF2249 domain-containing protein n=1 Tax=Halorubellus sp. PRR65 TaxID=3098148 RepID=UPI002B25DEC7|nr:DUF2249 domain-containing protein [Halorubellus sp. PRR65]
MSEPNDHRELDALTDAGVPETLAREHVDVADLPPPEPLVETLERLGALPDDGVLVQTNDRVPQHLFPKLEERGFTWEHVERDDGTVLTAIWRTD